MREGGFTYRGWTVVALAAFAMVATLPGRTVGLGLITEPMLANLGIAKTDYASLTFWATILGSLFSLGCGPAIDRWGIRLVLPAVSFALAATTTALGGFALASNLLLLLILSRGFGQSALSTASVTAVGKWFSSHLGLALAVFSSLVALGFAITIPVLGGTITHDNWRTCWIGVGGVIAVMGVICYVLIPSDPLVKTAPGQEEPTRSVTWGNAMRSQVFWTITFSTALYYLFLSGLTLFNEAVIFELGFGRNVFITAMAAMMGAGLLGNFLSGWLETKVGVPRLLAVNLLFLALVLLSFPFLNSAALVILHAAIYGVCGGAFTVLFFVGYGKAFGRQHLGKIQGTAQVLGVTASALGPKLLAETEAITGSFMPAFRYLAPFALILAIASWLTRMPEDTAEY